METPAQTSKQQRAAAVAKFVTNVAPADAPKETLEKKIHEWQHELLQLRKKGYSPEQLVAFLAQPEINIQASTWTVKRVLAGGLRKHPKAGMRATPEVVPTSVKP